MGKIFIVKSDDALYSQVLNLRQKILRDPLNMTFTAEELDRDKTMTYFAYMDKGKIRGTVGLEKISDGKGQLRQMAVDDKTQGQGLGRQLVEFLEDYSRKQGFKEIHLDSRYPARGFYARLGYAEYGEIYDKIGLKHIDMKKVL